MRRPAGRGVPPLPLLRTATRWLCGTDRDKANPTRPSNRTLRSATPRLGVRVASGSGEPHRSGVLEDFVAENRDAIVALARARVATRASPKPTEAELTSGVPVFLEQLTVALRSARSNSMVDHEELGKSATQHGSDLLHQGLTIGQVVHDYGDVCQSITALAVQRGVDISTEDFKTLNLCLDDAIAGAVTEFARQRESVISNAGTERLGMLAHEMRNLLNTAALSFDSIRSGRVAPNGSTAEVHSRSLMGLRDLIDRSLAEVRIDAGIQHQEPISAAEFIEEVEIAASLQAKARNMLLDVAPVERTLFVNADRHNLAAVLSNLLQNAFKFSHAGSHVSLKTRATHDKVLFEVEDECGGLPPGAIEHLFRPFEQRSRDRSGLGLGLAISLKLAKASGGELHARDLPGKGCVFTLELPRHIPSN